MQSDNDHIGLIEKYLDGDMDESDRAEFNRLISDSTEFRHQLREAEQVIASLRNDHHAKLKSSLRTMYDETVAVERESNSRRIYYWAAAAVIFIVGLVWTYTNFNTRNPHQVFLAYYEAYPMNLTTRAERKSDDAERLYKMGDFTSALPLLIEKSRQNPTDDITRLHIGNCYLAKGDYEQAITIFTLTTSSDDEIISQTGQWYLALTHLAASDVGKSADVLKRIVDGNGLYKSKASNLLTDLNVTE